MPFPACTSGQASQRVPCTIGSFWPRADFYPVTELMEAANDLQRELQLATLPNWRVLMVADQKTPTDWHLDNVTVLTVEAQQQLPYKILKHIPLNNYGRKNIGYLYAIQHGAQVIYETNDDNLLQDDIIVELVSRPLGSADPEFGNFPSGHVEPAPYILLDSKGNDTNYNPYPHFGQPHMWPRGFPMDSIKDPQPTCFRRGKARPLIQQALADNDPDVDAIYRLTQPLGVTFDATQFALVLPEGTMAPFNSQRTLFMYDALWAMILPVTTTMRVTDIWRGYWAQRLLWEIPHARLAFLGRTVTQIRNPHTVYNDYSEEHDLYDKAGALIDDLRAWQASTDNMPQQMIKLANFMASKGYWGKGDAQLIEAWVNDLTTVGYKFPVTAYQAFAIDAALAALEVIVADAEKPKAPMTRKLQQQLPDSSKGGNGGTDKVTHPTTLSVEEAVMSVVEQDIQDRLARLRRAIDSESLRAISNFIFPQRWCRYLDIVLVVNFNRLRHVNYDEPGNSQHLMGMLYAAYKPWFQEVYFVGNTPGNWTNVNPQGQLHHKFVDCSNLNVHDDKRHMPGHFAYVCLAAVMAQRQQLSDVSTTGYLYINDDVIFSPCMLSGFDRNKIWHDNPSLRDLTSADEFMTRVYGVSAYNVSEILDIGKTNFRWDFSNGMVEGVLADHIQWALSDTYGWMADQVSYRLGDNGTGSRWFGTAQADFFYIPARFVGPYMTFAHLMRSHFIPSEPAIANILGLLGNDANDYEIVLGASLWGRDLDWNKTLVPGLNLDSEPVQRVFCNGSCRAGVGAASFQEARAAVPAMYTANWFDVEPWEDLFALHPYKMSSADKRTLFELWWMTQNCKG